MTSTGVGSGREGGVLGANRAGKTEREGGWRDGPGQLAALAIGRARETNRVRYCIGVS